MLAATDVACTVEASGDLLIWSSGSGSTTQVAAIHGSDGTMQTVTVRGNVAEGSTGRRSLRSKVTLP